MNAYLCNSYIHMKIFCAWVKHFHDYEQLKKANWNIIEGSTYEEDTYGWFFKSIYVV